MTAQELESERKQRSGMSGVNRLGAAKENRPRNFSEGGLSSLSLEARGGDQ
jgi:hypothetical protein